MNVTSIVSSHCSLVACVVVSCLDFPIVACSAAGLSDKVTACSAAGSIDEVTACSAHVDVASLARVPASLGCLSASAASAAAASAASAVVAALLAG